MKVFPKERLDAVIVCSSFVFVGLNVADAWFTRQLIGMGFREANPIVTAYGSTLVIKGLLALVIVWLLMRFGKVRLLLILNCCMLAIVLWNGIGLLWLGINYPRAPDLPQMWHQVRGLQGGYYGNSLLF